MQFNVILDECQSGWYSLFPKNWFMIQSRRVKYLNGDDKSKESMNFHNTFKRRLKRARSTQRKSNNKGTWIAPTKHHHYTHRITKRKSHSFSLVNLCLTVFISNKFVNHSFLLLFSPFISFCCRAKTTTEATLKQRCFVAFIVYFFSWWFNSTVTNVWASAIAARDPLKDTLCCSSLFG